MGKRERLDRLLVDRGMVSSRQAGRGMIMAGEILVEDQPIVKAGALVASDAAIRIKSRNLRYVSRGGYKLEKALQAFNIAVAGKSALDVGASTGGFTDCLLAHGASRVYAVDVGYGQLDWKLRIDPRVVIFEKTNIRYLDSQALPAPVDVAAIDVSFISLRLVLLPVKNFLASAAQVIALIKPQFEVGKGKVGKGGVVRAADEHARVVEEITKAAGAIGYASRGVIESPLRGPKGNKEFLLYLTLRD